MSPQHAIPRSDAGLDVLPLQLLPQFFRERAADFRRWTAAEGAACALEQAAAMVEAGLAEQSNRLVSPAEAANLVDRHRDTIGNALRDGRLTNYGSKQRPLIKFGELTLVFPPRSVADASALAYHTQTDARSRLSTRRGD